MNKSASQFVPQSAPQVNSQYGAFNASVSQARRPLTAAESREQAELNKWLAVCGQVDDPVMARLIVELFEDAPALREQHPGLYLSARKAIQAERIRYAKAQRRAHATANAMHSLGELTASLFGALRTCVTLMVGAVRANAGKRAGTAPGAIAASSAVGVVATAAAATTRDESTSGRSVPEPVTFSVPSAELTFPPIVDPWLH